MSDASLLRLLEPNDALRAAVSRSGGEVHRAGPFEVYLHPDPHSPGFGYAQPIEPLPGEADTIAGLHQVQQLFAERGLALSIEFNRPLFPGLPALLASRGLLLTEREPLLVLDPADFEPSRSREVEVRFLQPDDPDNRLSAYSRIFTETLLDKPYVESDEEIARLRAEAKRLGGRAHALAVLDGSPAGTGFISVLDGVVEVNRVATLPEARRRGVAATLTSFMLEHAFRSGARIVWLTAAGRPAQILYENLGFHVIGERLYYASPSD